MAIKNTDNTVLFVNKANTAIGLDKDPNFDDMRLVFDGVVWPDPSKSPYMLKPGQQVHVGAGYEPNYLAYVTDMGVSINNARFLEIAVGPSDVTDSKVWTVVSDSGDDGSGLIYKVQDQTNISMTMAWADKNTVLMVNKAKGAIKIDRDPNFDDMKLIFDGVTSMGWYMLEPGQQVFVGSTYGTDMGVVITYNGDERYMEMAAGPTQISDSKVWSVIMDGEDNGSGPLTYDLADQTPDSMTMTWFDKS